MAKLESNLKNMVLVLTVVALVASFLLASVYSLTEEPIKEAKLIKQQNAIKEVLPEFDKLDDVEVVNELNVYKAYNKNSFVGAAVESSSPNGYGGEIKIMVGFDKNGRVYNYSVLEHKETPGLGSKMVDWFKTDKGNRSIINKDPAKEVLMVTKDGGSVDIISGSTITSRAFLNAVMSAYNAYANNPDAVDTNSGATSASTSELPELPVDSLNLPVDSLPADSVDARTDATTQATTGTEEIPTTSPEVKPAATVTPATPTTKPQSTTKTSTATSTTKTSTSTSSGSSSGSSTKTSTTTSVKEEKSDIDTKLEEKQKLIEEARKLREQEAAN